MTFQSALGSSCLVLKQKTVYRLMLINAHTLIRLETQLPLRGRRFLTRRVIDILELVHANVFAPYFGMKLSIPLREVYVPYSVGGCISRNSNFEEDTSKTFAKHINSGMTVIDIGANIGATSLQLSQLVGQSGSVYSFEPHPVTFQHLLRSLALSRLDNVHATQSGLGSSKSTASLKYNPLSTGWSSINGIGVDYPQTAEITIIRLDDFVSETGINGVDFIKVDVEGYEMEVFKGGEVTFSRYKPVVQFEYNKSGATNSGWSFRDAYDFFSKCGYRSFHLTNGKVVSRDFDIPEGFTDIVAVP